MNTVIGLFWSEQDIKNSIQKLEEAGIPKDSVDVVTHISRKRLCSNLCHPVARSAAWGAIVGVAIYATCGLMASVIGCRYCGFGSEYAVGTLVGFPIIGALVGALLGQWIGLAASEQDSHLYTQAAHLGGKVVTVQASAEMAANVIDILQQGNAVGVRTLES